MSHGHLGAAGAGHHRTARPGGAAPDTAPGEAAGGATAGGFRDLGRVGTRAFGEAEEARYARHPHAFTDGGRTGTVPWAGGGAGARGNEPAGSLQVQVPPTYTATAGPGPGMFTAFQTADVAANAPSGTVDTADIAAGWVVNIGAGTVNGTNYTHRTCTTTEPAPPP